MTRTYQIFTHINGVWTYLHTARTYTEAKKFIAKWNKEHYAEGWAADYKTY